MPSSRIHRMVYGAVEHASEGPAHTVSELDHASFAKAVAYIERNLSQRISINGLAELVAISRYHFSRRFKISAGVSPHAFIEKHRMERARALLIQTGLPLEEIAEQVGLSHMGNFRKQFRKHFGMNPSNVRGANAEAIAPLNVDLAEGAPLLGSSIATQRPTHLRERR